MAAPRDGRLAEAEVVKGARRRSGRRPLAHRWARPGRRDAEAPAVAVRLTASYEQAVALARAAPTKAPGRLVAELDAPRRADPPQGRADKGRSVPAPRHDHRDGRGDGPAARHEGVRLDRL